MPSDTPQSWPGLTWVFAGFLCFFALVLTVFVVDWLMDVTGVREMHQKWSKNRSSKVDIDGGKMVLPVHHNHGRRPRVSGHGSKIGLDTNQQEKATGTEVQVQSV
ncbi:hypothetical protein BC835DRAFT_1412203 [Cytidiella melzeri]|nr:hypothetical protein BC835DRAFT_1412203 [Cytidiella melzeri]